MVPFVLILILLFAVALAAGMLSGLVGTGSSLILLPLLVVLYGPRVSVPVMAIASVLGNLGRVLAWWREIQWRPVLAYSLPGIPAAVLGAHTLLTISPRLADCCLAAFFAGVIPLRRLAARKQWTLNWWQLAVSGAVIGFLTGLIFSTGPLSVPVFTGYGLAGGAFLGSEAASALLLYAGKLATFGRAGVLNEAVLARGLVIGAALLAGSLAARRLLRSVSRRRYHLLIDAVLVVAAGTLLFSALR